MEAIGLTIRYADLWERWIKSRDLAARNALAEAYLWLVRWVAGRLMVGLPPHFEQEDVEGHGCFGLLDAIHKYDPSRGIRFETYAIPWVRGACLQGIKAQQWAPSMRRRVRELLKVQERLAQTLGREPTEQELAAAMHLTPEGLQERLAEVGTLTVLSLEETVIGGEGESAPLAERLADPDAPDPVECSAEAERRELLAQAIDTLPEQERLVISLFYYEGLLATEISDLLGLSAARISQIHSKAVMRLRGKLARMKRSLVS